MSNTAQNRLFLATGTQTGAGTQIGGLRTWHRSLRSAAPSTSRHLPKAAQTCVPTHPRGRRSESPCNCAALSHRACSRATLQDVVCTLAVTHAARHFADVTHVSVTARTRRRCRLVVPRRGPAAGRALQSRRHRWPALATPRRDCQPARDRTPACRRPVSCWTRCDRAKRRGARGVWGCGLHGGCGHAAADQAARAYRSGRICNGTLSESSRGVPVSLHNRTGDRIAKYVFLARRPQTTEPNTARHTNVLHASWCPTT